MASQRTAALPFIAITLLLNVLGFSVVIPVLPKLVTGFGGDLSSGSSTFGWFVAVYAILQFVFSPILGSLSDMYGRRPIILLSLLGSGLDYLLMTFAPSLGWLFVGRIISGITGASITAVNAYVVDVSPPEKRARNYGLLGACFGLGLILGPAIGGLLGSLGVRVPFMAAAGLSLINAAYGFFILPESLKPEHRKRFSFRSANPLSSLGALNRFQAVLGLTATVVCLSLAQQALHSTWILFTTYRFDWTELQNGISMSVAGATAAVVQGGLTPVLVPRIGERRGLLAGLFLNAVSFVLFGLSTEGWMIYAVLVVNGLGGIAGPSAQALITQQVGPTEQGSIQGAVQSLMSLTGVVGPLLFTYLFGYFTSPSAPVHLPGMPFFAAAVCVVLALGLALRSLVALPARAPAAGEAL